MQIGAWIGVFESPVRKFTPKRSLSAYYTPHVILSNKVHKHAYCGADLGTNL